jgi:hypothetical protein
MSRTVLILLCFRFRVKKKIPAAELSSVAYFLFNGLPTTGKNKLMGRWIAALPSRPVHNTVQYSSLPELNESYDCTLSNSPVPYPLWWRVIQPFPLSDRRQTKLKFYLSQRTILIIHVVNTNTSFYFKFQLQ